MPILVKELSWFEEAGEKVLGLVVLDLSDADYACYVLGRETPRIASERYGSNVRLRLNGRPPISLKGISPSAQECHPRHFIKATRSGNR
jgi:hypothetical protein